MSSTKEPCPLCGKPYADIWMNRHLVRSHDYIYPPWSPNIPVQPDRRYIEYVMASAVSQELFKLIFTKTRLTMSMEEAVKQEYDKYQKLERSYRNDTGQ